MGSFPTVDDSHTDLIADNERENSTRKSRRTPKTKVIKEYGYIAKRRKGHIKKMHSPSKTERIISNLSHESSHVTETSSDDETNAEKIKPQRSKQEKRPSHEIRYDGIEHYPEAKPFQRCKMEGCTSRSYVYCSKCKVSLCLKRNMNCFKAFHIRSSEHNS